MNVTQRRIGKALAEAATALGYQPRSSCPDALMAILNDARLDIAEAQRRLDDLIAGKTDDDKPVLTLPLYVGQKVRMRSGATGEVTEVSGLARTTYCLKGYHDDYWWYDPKTGKLSGDYDEGEERNIIADLTETVATEEDGWFTHDPLAKDADCPAEAHGSSVEVRLRDGSELSSRHDATSWNWGRCTNVERQIVAWRFKD